MAEYDDSGERPDLPDQPSGRSGPWRNRVRFAPGAAFAYRPGEVLVPASYVEQAISHPILAHHEIETQGLLEDAFALFRNVPKTLHVIAELRRDGVPAQVNHVLFATGCCCDCGSSPGCPPHPSASGAEEDYAANPFYANPFYANPFYANPAGGCGCGGGPSANPFYANPFYANPFYANPFYANPFYANAEPNPGATASSANGRRRSSAVPTDPPPRDNAGGGPRSVRVAIVDTGYAHSAVEPSGTVLDGANVIGERQDVPTDDGDDYLDPAAGHGTFIAGIIEQIAPGCALQIVDVLTTYGDGDEVTIATALLALADQEGDDHVHFANLSFGGYSPSAMSALAFAIAKLQANGTVVVASAGNDATCVPMYPASLPGVVGVAALDEDGAAAPFTNYGPWVRAATQGVNIVSCLFEWNGAEPLQGGVDPDDFAGGARWSGTSFAAPRVVARLARLVNAGVTPQQAVLGLIDDPNRPHKPMLGTVVE